MPRKTKHEYKSTQRYSIEQKPGESDYKYYRRLAKVADQRLVRIEELSKKPEFKKVKKYGYSVALYDIQKYNKGGKRFNTKPPVNDQGQIVEERLKEKIQDIKRFLELPTSTKVGIVEVYKKRADTINERYGTNFTWQELADFFNKAYNDKISKYVAGSKTALYAIGTIQKTEDKLIAGIKSNTSITADDVNIDAAISLLQTNLKIPGISYTPEKKRKIKNALKEMQTE